MLGFRRNRSARAKPLRPALGSSIDALEPRLLMSADYEPSYYHATFLTPESRDTHPAPVRFKHPYGTPARQLSFLDNDGKVLTGKDRDGDEWQITVHGPGAVIVTDVTPNDGALDDEIDTIQIVGSNPNRTQVTGQVVASARVLSDGVVFFENLISLEGAHSIELNGFSLGRTTTVLEGSLANQGPEIYLPSGVGKLSFNDIVGSVDTALADEPFDIVIGEPNSPLRRAPRIQMGSIFNTVFDSTVTIPENGFPPVVPTVNIVVNGQIQSLDMVSATGFPVDQPGFEFVFPQVSTTGRTAIRADGIHRMRAVGSLRNTTVSRAEQPFSNGQSGLNRLGRLEVGGVSDGLGVDVSRGRIGSIALARGLGDTDGALPGDLNLGVPDPQRGNAAFGLMGGLITAREIGRLQAGPSHYFLDLTQDPDYRQEDRTNWTKYYPRNGRAFINTGIIADGSIGAVDVAGDAQNSEIKSGTNYPSLVDGLEGERAASSIRPVRWKGHLVDSVVSATYRPGTDQTYGVVNRGRERRRDTPGPGRIQGELVHGSVYQDGSRTILNRIGSGFFARRKQGYLPPPPAPRRVDGVNLDL